MTRRRWWGYLYLVPTLGCMALFVYYPLVSGAVYSFQKVNFVDPPRFVGWDNFVTVFNDARFWTAWSNTGMFTMILLILGQLLPLVLATMMVEMGRKQGIFHLAAYLPVTLPPIVTSLLWLWMLDPASGLANQLLGFMGMGPEPLLSSSDQALPLVAMVVLWASWGFTALLYVSNLQSIPSELYEASELDGASLWHRYRYVTLPHVRGLVLVLLNLGLINSAQLFTEPFAMTGGGPVNSTTTVVMLVYQYAFVFGNVGAASALGLILMLVLMTLSALYWYAQAKFTDPS